MSLFTHKDGAAWVDIGTLNEYREKGLITVNAHEWLPLRIWTYTKDTQYIGAWDEVTMACRGLVTDTQGQVVARPWPKFFNLEEERHEPFTEFEVWEKLDGSLGIIFFYDGKWRVATKGSFHSEQAVEGARMLHEKNISMRDMRPYMTYLAEIIYPENKVIVDYGEARRLVLLGVIHTATGLEPSLQEIRRKVSYNLWGFDAPKFYDGLKDFSVIKEMIESWDNEEGVVLRYPGGRVKIKREEYVRLHKLLSDLTNKKVWECLSSGMTIEQIIQDVPDELFELVEKEVNRLQAEYDRIHNRHLAYHRALKEMGFENRKSLAQHIFKEKPKNIDPSLVFYLEDGKFEEYNQNIWKTIKPTQTLPL
jgi:RNA ligase